MFSRIVSTGSSVPQLEVGNDQLAELVDTSDEWIVTRTGMSRRHIATTDSTSSLAAAASRKALDAAGLSADDVDLIVVATVTPDNFTPTVACEVQAALGNTTATCFDLWAGCSGFVHSIKVADSMIRTGSAHRALVIGAETLSRVVDWSDRNTCVLFGDGAGAVVLEASDEPGVLACVTRADGSRSSVLHIPGLANNNPWAVRAARAADATENADVAHSPTPSLAPSVISMDGQEVFRFAVGAIQWSLEEAAKMAGISIGSIQRIIPHQANNRIIDAVASRMGIERDAFYTNLQRFGNTSAASIPLALDELNRAGQIPAGAYLALVGFGGGLTWGGSIIRWAPPAA